MAAKTKNPTLEILKRYYSLYKLWRDHGYLPDGSAPALKELAQLKEQFGGGKTNMGCKGCITDMLKRVYHGYEEKI